MNSRLELCYHWGNYVVAAKVDMAYALQAADAWRYKLIPYTVGRLSFLGVITNEIKGGSEVKVRKSLFMMTIFSILLMIPLLGCYSADDEDSSSNSTLTPSSETSDVTSLGPLLLDPDDIKNPLLATEYGIKGYVDIQQKDTPEQVILSRGETWSTELSACFVSYEPELSQVELHVDANDNYGVKSGKYYMDEHGQREYFNFSELVGYNPSGSFILRDGETINFVATIEVPEEFPSQLISLPRGLLIHTIDIDYDYPGIRMITSEGATGMRVYVQ